MFTVTIHQFTLAMHFQLFYCNCCVSLSSPSRDFFVPSISISSGSLSCCSPAFCCCCCWVWWWFMLATVVKRWWCLLSLFPSNLSVAGSAGSRLLGCWWGVCGCGGGIDRSNLVGWACSKTTSAFSPVSAGDWGEEVGGGAGRETRTYLLAIRPISAPWWVQVADGGDDYGSKKGRPVELNKSRLLPRVIWGNWLSEKDNSRPAAWETNTVALF